MKHVIEHGLDAATAHKVTERAFAEYRARYPAYDPTLTWTSDRAAKVGLSAKGLKLAGSVVLRDGAIDVELEVPLLLRVFQKRAMEVIDREVRAWVERARTGEI
jgi:hypothetical protein